MIYYQIVSIEGDWGGAPPTVPISFRIYVVLSELLDGMPGIEDFVKLSINWGKNLESVKIYLPLKTRYGVNHDRIIKRPWGYQDAERIKSIDHPYWLITRKTLSNFFPKRDDFAIIHFSGALDNVERYIQVLNKMQHLVEEHKDLIEWANALHRRPIYKKLYDSLQLKPNFFGFGIDLKVLLEEGMDA